jgi:signal recognition particle subunit SRP54
MFDNLSDKLQRVFKTLRGEGKLSAENMEAALREIRVALLEADVHFRVVKQFMEAVKEQAMGQEVLTALSPTQQVIKIVRDEMVKMLGTHQAKLRMANEPPSVFMIVGLQGSGKTTSTAKLARWLSKNGSSPLMVSVDVYRPAARKQLSVLARDLKLPIYEGTPEAAGTGAFGAEGSHSDGARRGAGRYRRAPAYRRRPDDGTEPAQRNAEPFGNPVRRRRYDGAGRRQVGR